MNLGETEAHKLLKKRAFREFKKRGFKSKEICVEDHKGGRIPDIAAGNIVFEGGNIDIKKFIEYKEEGKKLVYQPFISSISKNKGKKLKYVCTSIDEFCRRLGFVESGSYTYKLGCLRISMWAVYQKYRYPKIESIKIFLSDNLIISRNVPDFMQIGSFLNNLFFELTEFVSEEKINQIKESVDKECKDKIRVLEQEAHYFCDLRRSSFEDFEKIVREERDRSAKGFGGIDK